MKNKDNIFIIHGWASNSQDCFIPWLAKILSDRGCNVCTPNMPNPYHPDINKWIDVLKNLIKHPDKNTYLIGHSLGCYIILKYLEELKNKEVGGVLCIAGSMGIRGKLKIEPNKVLPNVKKIIALFSDNDYYIPLSEKKEFESKLNATVCVLHNMGHFSRKENTRQIPEIIPLLEKLIT